MEVEDGVKLKIKEDGKMEDGRWKMDVERLNTPNKEGGEGTVVKTTPATAANTRVSQPYDLYSHLCHQLIFPKCPSCLGVFSPV